MMGAAWKAFSAVSYWGVIYCYYTVEDCRRIKAEFEKNGTAHSDDSEAEDFEEEDEDN
jgi:hypothetical protein